MATTLFTHAYELSVKLGVKYVWIDSLCIVQDDAEDWKRESAKMADYYQQAWLTVAATRTRNDGGLFGEFETKDLARVTRLPYRDRNGSQKGYFYLQCPGGKAISRDYKNAVSQSELLRRGWVYQEWLLSRRILAFADYGLFVQCETGYPQSLAGDDVKFIRDDEDGDEWDTSEKPDKSFKSSGEYQNRTPLSFLHRVRNRYAVLSLLLISCLSYGKLFFSGEYRFRGKKFFMLRFSMYLIMAPKVLIWHPLILFTYLQIMPNMTVTNLRIM